MLRSTSVLLALAAAGLALPATSGAATKPAKAKSKPAKAKKAAKLPVVSKVSPKKIVVGQTLTITGKNFRAGTKKNTVVFKRDGKPGVFVRSGKSTSTSIKVAIPDKVAALLSSGSPATFRVRVITTRFAKSYTQLKDSPVISPRASSAGTQAAATPVPLTPYEACKAGLAASPMADADLDGLPNLVEAAASLDACTPDTDGDSLVDGYEYSSAVDLNSRALPYPGKRPWPNPLDPTDGKYDFDGDGLTLSQEGALWRYSGGLFPVNAYSDGTQNSGGTMPTIANPARLALDVEGDGNLTDDERDADNDGLSNITESNLRATVAWWTAAIPAEQPYSISTFAETSFIDPDTDGDGVLDGADDQDHDGYDNYHEIQLTRSAQNLRVQPFNPCLPNPYSPTCSRYVPFTNAWPPFDGTQDIDSVVPFDLANTPAGTPGTGWNGTGGPQGA